MLICILQPWNRNETGQRSLVHAFAHCDPLAAKLRHETCLRGVEYRLFWLFLIGSVGVV